MGDIDEDASCEYEPKESRTNSHSKSDLFGKDDRGDNDPGHKALDIKRALSFTGKDSKKDK